MITISGDNATVAGFKAGQYMGRIRNASKYEYAHNYFNWILRGRIGTEPDRRLLLNGTLSFMAAQAVRNNLEQIMREQEA